MNTILSFLADWKIKLAIIALVIIGAFTWHKIDVKVKVNKAVTEAVVEIREQTARENFRIRENSLNSSIELQSKIDKIQKDKNNEITDLKSRVRTLSNSLSERPANRQEPSRVPDNPGNSDAQTGATGLQLSRSDGEFLSWFAGETAELQVELNSCLKKYSTAKETLDKFKKDNSSKTN